MNTLVKLRYRFWPDKIFGELLQKPWMETAVPLLVLLGVIAFFSTRIDNFISVASMSDTLRQACELGFVVLGMSIVLIVGASISASARSMRCATCLHSTA
jgi:ribose transport system permease protein